MAVKKFKAASGKLQQVPRRFLGKRQAFVASQATALPGGLAGAHIQQGKKAAEAESR